MFYFFTFLQVIYYEHAQHQHHYDDHGEDVGGYWKRSNEPYNYGAQYGYDLQDVKA